MITYVFEGLSTFRSKGCIVGVVVDGVEGVCELQYFSLPQIAHELTILISVVGVDVQLVKRCVEDDGPVALS
jgi:hypothetical protein